MDNVCLKKGNISKNSKLFLDDFYNDLSKNSKSVLAIRFTFFIKKLCYKALRVIYDNIVGTTNSYVKNSKVNYM